MPVYYNEAVKQAKKNRKGQKDTGQASMKVMNEGKKARLTRKGGDSKRSDR